LLRDVRQLVPQERAVARGSARPEPDVTSHGERAGSVRGRSRRGDRPGVQSHARRQFAGQKRGRQAGQLSGGLAVE
jgi:hypothetical protein